MGGGPPPSGTLGLSPDPRVLFVVKTDILRYASHRSVTFLTLDFMSALNERFLKMAGSHYPNGFSGGVSIRGLPILNTYGGNLFWVHSGSGSDGNDGTEKRPFATIDYAIGRCTASNGDIIMVKAGHAETLAADITMDVIGVSVIGIGRGTLRPTITVGAFDGTVAMTAANSSMSGVRFVLEATDDTVTSAFTITADGCMVERCETVVHATAQFTSHLTATDAQFVEIRENIFKSLQTASSTSGIVVDGCDDLMMDGNVVDGHFGEHALDNTTPGSADEILRATITNNLFINRSTTAGDLCVELDAAATGFFAYNQLVGGLSTTAANYDIGNMATCESYISDSVGVDVATIIIGTAAV